MIGALAIADPVSSKLHQVTIGCDQGTTIAIVGQILCGIKTDSTVAHTLTFVTEPMLCAIFYDGMCQCPQTLRQSFYRLSIQAHSTNSLDVGVVFKFGQIYNTISVSVYNVNVPTCSHKCIQCSRISHCGHSHSGCVRTTCLQQHPLSNDF